MVGRWIKRVLVAAVVVTGSVVACQHWADRESAPSSGTAWLIALALVGLVAGALALILREGSIPAAIALMLVCVAPGPYHLNAAILVWGAVDLVRALRAKRRPA